MTVVIAEAGVNHNGDARRAHEMVDAAAESGADIVKFQAFSAEGLVAADTATASYQNANTGENDQLSLLKNIALKPVEFVSLARKCRESGIEFLCTAFDFDLLEALIDAGMRRIKIPSGDLTNSPMLRRVARLELPVILSTGMATLNEVQKAVAILREAGTADITVLHCTSLYPAPDETINLRAMITMKEVLKLPVGYSDHSLDDLVATSAVALGATIIEKHFTPDRRLPGPDHKASLEPQELKSMISKIRRLEKILGYGVKRPAPGELETALLVRRSWHAARALDAGTVMTPADIVLKRPATGLAPDSSPVGRILRQAREVDQPIRATDID